MLRADRSRSNAFLSSSAYANSRRRGATVTGRRGCTRLETGRTMPPLQTPTSLLATEVSKGPVVTIRLQALTSKTVRVGAVCAGQYIVHVFMFPLCAVFEELDAPGVSAHLCTLTARCDTLPNTLQESTSMMHPPTCSTSGTMRRLVSPRRMTALSKSPR